MKRRRRSPIDLTIHRVMGVDELDRTVIASASRVVSILDPQDGVPLGLVNIAVPVLTLRFDDVIVPELGAVMVTKAAVRRLLAFDRNANHDERLLIHCTAGISRSPAALIALLAARHPELCDELFVALRQIRPRAWPNSLLLAFADDALGRGGELMNALHRHYEAQLRHPKLGRMFRMWLGESELPSSSGHSKQGREVRRVSPRRHYRSGAASPNLDVETSRQLV
jgi:predicted protein tyrosine phosphatase